MASGPSILDRLKNTAFGVGVGRIAKAVGVGEDPYADPRAESMRGQATQKGRVFQRWTYPFRGYSMPILEVPSNRVQRYLLAFEYFTSDPIVNAAIRIKTEFALSGMDFDVMIEEDEWPDWVADQHPEWKEEYEKLVEDERNKNSELNGNPAMPQAGAVPEEKLGAPSPTKPIPGVVIGAEGDGTPVGGRKPSPSQDNPQISDVGRTTNNATSWQPGQDMTGSMPVPATNLTPIHQFVSNKIKLELLRLSDKLDLQSWIINFASEAMIFGDGFANIVDGWEVKTDEGVDEVSLDSILKKNDQLEEIRAQYAQAYEKFSPKDEYDGFIKRVTTAAKIVFKGTAATLSVDPSLLTHKAEAKVADWHAGNGGTIYRDFLATAKERDLLSNSKNYTIAEMQTLNPSAVWVTRNDVGQVILIELVKRIGVDASPLNIPDIIHWKWQGPEWMTYGMSDFFPAFRHLKLKRTLEEALAANAERYANPIIQVKVGTDKVARLQVPSQAMVDDAAALLAEYDRKSVLTTPYHWDIEIHGMDGKPLRIDYPLTYANEQTIAVLGIPKTFLWGDGGNFASVRAQFQTMIFRLKKMQHEASRIIITRIFNRFLDKRGWRTASGQLPSIEMKWAQQELDSEQSVIGLINAFSNLAKSVGSPELPISFTTLLESLGHNYEQELYRKGREKAMLRKMQGGQIAQPPSQTPAKEPPTRSKHLLRGVNVASLAENLSQLSWTRPDPQYPQSVQTANGSKLRRRRNPK